MDNIYIEYHFTITPKELGTEILIAELGAVGFESFVENENGVTGYIQKEDWNPTLLDTIFVLNSMNFQYNIQKRKLNKQIGTQNGKKISNLFR